MKVIFYFSLYKYIVWLEMSTRKYAFGYEKLKKRKKEEKLIESKKWWIHKFVINNKQNITQNLDENITNEQEIHQNNLEENDIQFCNFYPKDSCYCLIGAIGFVLFFIFLWVPSWQASSWLG